MLAGDVPAAANLIVNGDFETFSNEASLNFVNSFATARFYGSDLVPGWTVVDGDGDGTERINLLTFDNVRETVLDLDSLPGQDDRLIQDVNLSVGQQYLFSFDFLGPENVGGVSDSTTNNFDVFYNGELLGSLQGTSIYNHASFAVVGAANDSDGSTEAGDIVSARFEFRDGNATDRSGDGHGSLIDSVSLVAVTENAVVNGEFENTESQDGPFFAPEDVNGFSVFNFDSDTQDRVIEIRSGDDDETSDGDFLNLNSSPELIDQVFQDLDTVAGETYFVTFDARVDPASALPADQLRVRFDNQHAAAVIANDQWQTYSIVVEATSSTSRLNLREAGEDPGDGASPQIDNVQLFQVNVPVINDLVVDANGAEDGLTSETVFQFGAGPQSIAPDVVLSHDSGETLDGASIAIAGDSIVPTESLSVDVGATEIVADYDSLTGLLQLEGEATVAEYQQVIRTLAYDNTADDAPDRLVEITIADSNILADDNSSAVTLVSVVIDTDNDAPTLAAINDQTLAFGQSLDVVLNATDIDGDDSEIGFEVVDAQGLTGQIEVSDDGRLTLPVAAEAGTFEVTVAATDLAGASAEQTFEVNVAEFVPFEGVGALSNIPTELRDGIYSEQPPQNIDLDLTYDALIDTTQGEIRIRLLDDESPTFVNNFVNLARDGFYDGLTFHRVIEGFVAQGGDPLGEGFGGPGYQIPDEVDNDIEFDARGQLSFANSGNNTTGSQFFITLVDTGLSNDLFSVFGNVTSGDAVLDQLTRFEAGSTIDPEIEPDVINSIRIEEV
jgi:cyclophilin family peptidyl-prolyl cis-trans isomerase